jgi:hypothetical protein
VNAWGVLSQLYRLRPQEAEPDLKAEFKTEQYTDHRRELRRDLLLERPAISLLSQQRVSHLPSGFPFRTLTSSPDSPRCSLDREKVEHVTFLVHGLAAFVALCHL